jgi:RimJ/RimL family protein N-acetyltransferase
MLSPQKSSEPESDFNDMKIARPLVAVRELVVSEWEQLKSLRIEALEKHPHLFSEKVDVAKKRTDKEWQEMIVNSTSLILGAFVGGHMVGISAIFTDRSDPSGKTGFLGMSYIQEEFRRMRISEEFFAQRLSWAKNSPTIEKVSIGHREGNEPSRRNAERHGFSKEDGVRDDYEFTDGSKGRLITYSMPVTRSGA